MPTVLLVLAISPSVESVLAGVVPQPPSCNLTVAAAVADHRNDADTDAEAFYYTYRISLPFEETVSGGRKGRTVREREGGKGRTQRERERERERECVCVCVCKEKEREMKEDRDR